MTQPKMKEILDLGGLRVLGDENGQVKVKTISTKDMRVGGGLHNPEGHWDESKHPRANGGKFAVGSTV